MKKLLNIIWVAAVDAVATLIGLTLAALWLFVCTWYIWLAVWICWLVFV